MVRIPYGEILKKVITMLSISFLIWGMAATVALAAPKLTFKLINNRSETVWVAISSWDFDKNTSFTRGWYTVKPNSTITIPVGPKLDYPQAIYFYAKSNTRAWEGTLADLGECDDRVTEMVVRTNTKFEYWGVGGWQQNWKDWKRCIFLSVSTGEDGNLTYTFD